MTRRATAERPASGTMTDNQTGRRAMHVTEDTTGTSRPERMARGDR